MATDPYKKAKKKVKEKKEFLQHLAVFAIVMPFLFAINMLTSPFHYWFVYPLLGWGVGLAIHGITVFGFEGHLYKKWEEQEIEKELRKMEKDDDSITEPDEELELKEFKKLRKDMDDSEFV